MLKKNAGFAQNNIVNLQWNVPDSLSHKIKSVHIMKRDAEAFRFQPAAIAPVHYNAYGEMQKEYHYTDTLLHPGKYYYRLITEDNEGTQYFTEEFSYNIQPRTLSERDNTISVNLDYRKDTPISLRVVDAETLNVLDSVNFYFEIKAYGNIIFYTNKYLNRGIKMLEIQVIDKNNNHKKIHYYDLENPSFS